MSSVLAPEWISVPEHPQGVLAPCISSEIVTNRLEQFLAALGFEKRGFDGSSLRIEPKIGVTLCIISCESTIHEEKITAPLSEASRESGGSQPADILTDHVTLASNGSISLSDTPQPFRRFILTAEVNRKNCPCGDGSVRCSDCNGHGEFTCANCKGQGQWRCFKCQGGRVRCDGCAGRGEERCGSCKGRGRKDDGSDCLRCNGTGAKKCGRCGGSGERKCETCEGKGVCECASCCASGKLECWECGGKGKNVCGTCKGEAQLGEATRLIEDFKFRCIAACAFNAVAVGESIAWARAEDRGIVNIGKAPDEIFYFTKDTIESLPLPEGLKAFITSECASVVNASIMEAKIVATRHYELAFIVDGREMRLTLMDDALVDTHGDFSKACEQLLSSFEVALTQADSSAKSKVLNLFALGKQDEAVALIHRHLIEPAKAAAQAGNITQVRDLWRFSKTAFDDEIKLPYVQGSGPAESTYCFYEGRRPSLTEVLADVRDIKGQALECFWAIHERLAQFDQASAASYASLAGTAINDESLPASGSTIDEIEKVRNEACRLLDICHPGMSDAVYDVCRTADIRKYVLWVKDLEARFKELPETEELRKISHFSVPDALLEECAPLIKARVPTLIAPVFFFAGWWLYSVLIQGVGWKGSIIGASGFAYLLFLLGFARTLHASFGRNTVQAYSRALGLSFSNWIWPIRADFSTKGGLQELFSKGKLPWE